MVDRDMENRCEAETLQLDDRMGGILERCELHTDHPGPHVAERDACIPPAWLCWAGDFNTDEDPRGDLFR